MDRPIPLTVRYAYHESSRFFPTALQQFQFFDKYSRFNYDLGRRETWVETVDRAVDYLRELSQNRLSHYVYDRINQAIREMRVMPSMRLLAMAGPAARRNNLAIYNCAYMAVDSLDAFVEALIISMSGCGVGYSVERHYVAKLPQVLEQRGLFADTHVVEDTTEGWAAALRVGIETWFAGGDVQFDLSLVRPAGTPLRIKGGRASGPEPLRAMLAFVRSRILARQGGWLRPIDAHDIMCAVGNAAVSGGVRRTALISLFSQGDQEMLQCKSGDNLIGNEQRWNANNSVVWAEEPTWEQFSDQFDEMVRSGRGEPGFFSRVAANDWRPERRKPAEFGTNPCVTSDTWVLTEFGPTQVGALVGQPFIAMIDGKHWASTKDGFWQTGVKDVYEIVTEEGYTLRATADHPLRHVTHQSRKIQRETWTPVADLQTGDYIRLNNHRVASWDAIDHGPAIGWLLGSLVGDGTFSRAQGKSPQAIVRFWGDTAQEMAAMAHSIVANEIGARSNLAPAFNSINQYWQVCSTKFADVAAHYGITPEHKTITPRIEATSSAFHAAFLRGLFDADGTVTGTHEKGVSVRLNQSSVPLLQAAQRMLLRLGIASHIYQNRHDAGYRSMPDGQGGNALYWCRDNHDLVISNDNIQQFALRVGFADPQKAAKLSDLCNAYRRTPNRERFIARIASIRHVGAEPVYDCSIPGINAFDANGLYVHNCGEIALRSMQLCNLSAAIARAEDAYDDMADKVEVATIIGTIQSMATNFPGLRPQWQRNCEEERLLGVDITGQMDAPHLLGWQDDLASVARSANRNYARLLGINPSAAITCVKPSGNTSQLVNCSSGLHARWAPYYIRNVRVGAHSPIYQVLRDANVPMVPENGQTAENATTWVVQFPVKSPEGAITRNDHSAIEQCDIWLQNKMAWTEHNPSCTITYRPHEVEELKDWVWAHRHSLGGMSFLPASDAMYDNMPYVEISREEYERRAAEFPQIDFSNIYHYERTDLTNAAQELACVAGLCEI